MKVEVITKKESSPLSLTEAANTSHRWWISVGEPNVIVFVPTNFSEENNTILLIKHKEDFVGFASQYNVIGTCGWNGYKYIPFQGEINIHV